MPKTVHFPKEMNRYSCYDFLTGTQSQMSPRMEELPEGMKELAKECLAPETSAYFERKTNLPLLTTTKLTILKRLKPKKMNSNSTEKADAVEVKSAGENVRSRSNSILKNICECDDMLLLRTCWEVILSFMGDESEELDQGQSTGLFENTITQRRQHISPKKTWKKLPGNTEVVMRNKAQQRRPKSMILYSDVNGNQNFDNSAQNNGNCTFPKKTVGSMTVLEKVHFLVKVGLETRDFRDEIYCQILKQLVGNPSMRSVALGWILLSLVLGCFPPSDMILSYVERFLQQQRTAYSKYCLKKLNRTLECGERKNPPCSLELQAAKSRQEIRLPIICMDHSVRTVWCDSSTPASEMCDKMAAKNRLVDAFGYALYLALDNKLVSLGNQHFHVMDAVSQAEGFAKLNDIHELWRIYFRREFFSPRDACCVNNSQMDVWLTYSQISGGVQSGEYNCIKAQDLSLLISHQYCVKYGLDKIEMKRVVAVCDQALPASACEKGEKKKWCQMVFRTLRAIAQESRLNGGTDAFDVMKEVIRYGSKAFIENFTKTFHLSRFEAVANEKISKNDCVLRINHHAMAILPCPSVVSKSEASKKVLDVKVDDLLTVESLLSSGEKRIRISVRGGNAYDFFSSQEREIIFVLKTYLRDMISQESDA